MDAHPVVRTTEHKAQRAVVPRTPFPGHRSRCTGFTLLELIVVIVILSLSAALVFPLLPDTGSGALRRSARGTASLLRYLGEEAVTTKSTYRLYLEPGGAGFKVLKLNADGEEEAPGDPFLLKPVLAPGVSIVDLETGRLGKIPEGELRFDIGPGGIADLLSIHLQGTGGDRYTVTAYPASGKVTVVEGYQEAGL